MRHVVADPFENTVRMVAGELVLVRLAVGVRPVEIAADRDRRHANDGALEQAGFELCVLLLAVGEAQAPAVVVDGDGGVVATSLAVLVGTSLSIGLIFWASTYSNLMATLGDGLRLAQRARAEQIDTIIELRSTRAAISDTMAVSVHRGR